MNRTMYAEKTLADLLGISQALIKKASKGAGIGDGERVLVFCGGKKMAAYTVPGIRKLWRWLTDKKNAPRQAKTLTEKRLAALLEGAEVVEGGDRPSGRKDGVVRALAQPGGFPMPENMELLVMTLTRNHKIIHCAVPPEYKLAWRAAFEERGISLNSTRLRVQVRHCANFTYGMRLPVVLVKGDLFKCIAGRNPRWPGRW